MKFELKRYNTRPDKRIRMILYGPVPPEDFEGNGCTLSPDLWFREACRIHDWEYVLLDEIDKNTVKGLFEWENKRKIADKNLEKNIELLSTCYVDDNGFLIKREFKWYYKYGYKLSKIYYRAVRAFGWVFSLI